MKKSDVIERVAGEAGVTRAQAEAVIEAFFDTVRTGVAKDDSVGWPGFGSFSLSRRAARKGRNPQTGESLRIPASKGVRFTAGSALKEFMKSPRSAKKAAPAKKAATAAKAAPARKAVAKKVAAPAKTVAKKATAAAKKTVAKKAPAKKR